MARASPHHPTSSKPTTCPACNHPYAYRYHGPDSAFPTQGYACTYYGWTYVHQPASHPQGVLPE